MLIHEFFIDKEDSSGEFNKRLKNYKNDKSSSALTGEETAESGSVSYRGFYILTYPIYVLIVYR